MGVTRRQFLNRAYLAAVTVGVSNFALASLDYLLPRAASGAGTRITVGDAETLRGQLGPDPGADPTRHQCQRDRLRSDAPADVCIWVAASRGATQRSGSSALATARSIRSTVSTGRDRPPPEPRLFPRRHRGRQVGRRYLQRHHRAAPGDRHLPAPAPGSPLRHDRQGMTFTLAPARVDRLPTRARSWQSPSGG